MDSDDTTYSLEQIKKILEASLPAFKIFTVSLPERAGGLMRSNGYGLIISILLGGWLFSQKENIKQEPKQVKI